MKTAQLIKEGKSKDDLGNKVQTTPVDCFCKEFEKKEKTIYPF